MTTIDYIGLDVHKKSISFCAKAQDGRILDEGKIAAQHKVLYHAGAVFGSNYVAALLDIAEGLIGVEHAREDIAALAQSAIDNWRRHGTFADHDLDLRLGAVGPPAGGKG